jgi:DnaJ-class molecular chaperone
LVEIPRRLNKEQSDLLRRFAETEDNRVLPESKGFLDKFKEFLSDLREKTS